MPFDPFEQESADDQFFDAWEEYEQWSHEVDQRLPDYEDCDNFRLAPWNDPEWPDWQDIPF